MRVLIVGSSRSLAGRLISDLHARGWLPRVFLGAAFSLDLTRSFETVVGSLADIPSIVNALEGVDWVIHFEDLDFKQDLEDLRTLNITYTRNLVEACRIAGVMRLLHLSSASVNYARRTWVNRVQKTAEDIIRGSGLHWTIVRFPLIVGPHGERRYRILRRMVSSYPILPLPLAGRAAKRPVHEDDVLEGIRLILQAAPERVLRRHYFLGGKDILIVRELIALMSADLQKRMPWILPLPQKIVEWLIQWGQSQPRWRWISEMLCALTQDADGDISAAWRDLGYDPASLKSRLSVCRSKTVLRHSCDVEEMAH